MASAIFPVVLCGGSGTRLWPLSRAMYPKQFIPAIGTDGESLLAATLRRLAPRRGFERVTLLTNNAHRFLLLDEMMRTGTEAREILIEPEARNTAPAIAAAALSATAENPDAVLAVMPSDHVLTEEERFVQAVRQAAAIAEQNRLVLFGIKPAGPHTGYGYIRQGAPLGAAAGPMAFQAEAFTEKPPLETARRYLEDGSYLWNSGIFVLHAATFLEELERFAPEIAAHARAALAGSERDLAFRRLSAREYALCPNISVDYAVMEKTKKAAVMPLDLGWNDVGSWSALWEIAKHDRQGNALHGDVLPIDTRNSYIHAGAAFVATLGVENLVIVNTADALLVASRDRAQDVGKIVASLKAANRREYEQHVRNYRPWGHFETLNAGPRFQVKLLHVKPGGRLSLQMHHHRSEHWVVVKGTARVICEEEERLVSENESFYIKATQWHRLENPGKVPVEIIEVQIGSYLGEDDILRKDDIYQRGSGETK